MLTTATLFLVVGLLAVVALRRSGTRIGVNELENSESPPETAEEPERRWAELGREQVAGFVDRVNPRLLDVRTPGETRFGVIPGAVLIPLQELPARVEELPRDGRPTVVYCAHGVRSTYACGFLDRLDFPEIYNLSGGVATWPRDLERPS